MYWNNGDVDLMPQVCKSWIVTLDVLKCDLESGDNIKYKGWIVTLDVLK